MPLVFGFSLFEHAYNTPRDTPKMALNDRLIKALKPKEKAYKQTDGGGLYLFIRPNGTKTWRMKYTLDGKEQLATFGAYPAISLAEARLMRDELKAKLAKGVHTPKRAIKQQEKQPPLTFEQAAHKWFSVKQTQIAAKTQSNIKNRLENHLYPKIGGKELIAIKRADLIAITDDLNEKGVFAEAQKILQTASQVFEFAILNEWIENNPTHGLNALLKRAETVHREALPQSEVEPFFMAYLQGGGEPVTRIALLLVILTGARNQALRLSEWRNIDFEKRTWLMPSETMKQGHDFLIPLADWSIELLQELHTLTGTQAYLFPKSSKGGGYKPTLCESTLNGLMNRLGYDGKHKGKSKARVHGFRSLMTDVCIENGFSRDVVKAALSHQENDKVFAAYKRTELLDERRKMAEFYAQWLFQHYTSAQKAIAQIQLEQAQTILNK